MALIDTRFRDIAGRENKQIDKLTFKFEQLRATKKRRRFLSKAEQAEFNLIKAILREVQRTDDRMDPEVADPLFVATRALLNEGDGLLPRELVTHKDGVLVFKPDSTDQAVVTTALTLGLLFVDNVQAPPVVVVPQASGGATGEAAAGDDTGRGATIAPDTIDENWKDFTQNFFEAIGEARGMNELALLVLPILAIEGDPDGPNGKAVPTVGAEEFARVMRALCERKVSARESQLRRRVNEALDSVQRVGDKGPVIDLGIDLPDLEQIRDSNIIEENVRLMGPMIVSAMFDELKAYQAVNHMVERWRDGTLAIGSGVAGKLLYDYWREAPNRISETERRTFYAITMGVPGGENVDRSNREFNDLWIRFVSSVSEFVRQAEVDTMLRATLPSQLNHQQVRKTARDISQNLSLHGYGMAYYAAIELQDQIKFMIKLLSDPEIQAAYGARDMWQVIDHIATLDLGGAQNSSRYQTLATCGTIITAWLANNVRRINAATGPLLDVDEIRNPTTKVSGQKATTHPDDYDLVNACELWLADTAVSVSEVHELSSMPREAPNQTSAPVQMPEVVRDMLEGMGDLGVGLGRNR